MFFYTSFKSIFLKSPIAYKLKNTRKNAIKKSEYYKKMLF